MEEKIRILVVDDHPMMIEGYKTILNSIEQLKEALILTASNCEDVFKIIDNLIEPIHLVLLDINLPAYEQEKLLSGEDVAILLKKRWPDTKIIVVTSHTQTFLLFNLIKRINPEAVLVKSDFTPSEMFNAIIKVLENGTHFTITARQSLKDIYVDNNYLDAYNRRIISLLAKGVATKNLPNYLNITISAIDKRKAQIKEIFNIVKGGDEDILREARKRGFI